MADKDPINRTQIIVAFLGLVGVLGAAWIANRQTMSNGGDDVTIVDEQKPQQKQTGLPHATADDVVYTLLSAKKEPLSDQEYLLVLDLKVECQASCKGINFWEDLFRLEINGVKQAPRTNGSNQYVPPNAEWREAVQFVVPKNAAVGQLIVGLQSSGRTQRIPRPMLSNPD